METVFCIVRYRVVPCEWRSVIAGALVYFIIIFGERPLSSTGQFEWSLVMTNECPIIGELVICWNVHTSELP